MGSSSEVPAATKSQHETTATFLSLPLELRQAILLEAVAPDVHKALSELYFLGALGSEATNHPQCRRVRTSIASACRTMAAMRTVLATLKLESEIDWVERQCLDVLNAYKAGFPGVGPFPDGHSECFLNLSEWVLGCHDGNFKIKQYKAVIGWRLVFCGWNAFG